MALITGDLHVKPLKIIQDDALFKSGIDTVLLSDFASHFIKDDSSVIDLCSGNGIIPLLLSGTTKAKSIHGLELQKECVELAVKNVKLNNMEEKIKIIQGDIRNTRDLYCHKAFEYVTCNPPYFKVNSSDKIESLANNSKEPTALQIARHELFCTIEDVAKSSFWLLKDTGSLFLINRPDRLSDTIIALNNNKLYPKYIRFILPSQNERPTMFLIQAVKSSKTQLTIMENLVVYKSKGIYSDEVSKIYNLI